ncbi:hypothetical protein D3C87_1045810 [compost metagenome]
MDQQTKDAFIAAVKAKLAEAIAMYGLSFKVEDVPIRLDIRGQVAGYAGWREKPHGKVYHLRFNPEAIVNYNDDMTNDVIPHEVAHLVCFDRGTDDGHGYNWKATCRRLGGDDSRCHDMTLTAAKPRRHQTYTLASGKVVEVGPKYHARIQAGSTTIFFRNPKEYVLAHMWEHYGKAAPTQAVAASRPQIIPGLRIVRSDVPALPQFGSKREKAEIIYKANRGLERKHMLDLFVRHAEMTPAGAATYYQNFKKAGI